MNEIPLPLAEILAHEDKIENDSKDNSDEEFVDYYESQLRQNAIDRSEIGG